MSVQFAPTLEADVPPPAPEKNPELIPLSFAQQQLWLVDQLQTASSLYNVPAALRLRGALDCDALEKSLQAIVERHEVLRTVYTLSGDEPVQTITVRNLPRLPVVDLSGLAATEKEQTLRQQLADAADRPFDLSADLMIRAGLFRLADEEHVLFLNIHHIACDEWSLGVLFRELGQLYQSFGLNQPSRLGEPVIQYADFALWQREAVRNGLHQKQLSYWRERLQGDLPVLEFPADQARPSQPTHRGARIDRALPSALSEAVKTLGKQEGATLFMVLLSAFKVLLHRYTGQRDIIVGTPIAGRSRVELEELIGYFVNTLVVRTPIAPEMTFRDLLQRVKEESLGAFSHQDLPFEKLVEEIQPRRQAAHNPIFNVMFAVQQAAEEIKLAGLAATPLEVESRTAKFDLTLVFQDTKDGLTVLLEYSSDLFQRATAERLLANLETLLRGITANPAQPIAQLPLLSETEREQMLAEWNRTETPYPRGATVHHLFSAQAKRAPHEIAVVYGEQKLTFKEVEERSNQLANYLIKHGVGPDVPVGICVERSPEMIIGWLGILKAGGAYVPLDPGYPEERLAFMLEDAGMPLLLTQRKLAGALPSSTRKICLDADWKTISRAGTDAPISGATAENLAYIIYTSGSTGKPKGVEVTHRGIVRLLFDTNYIQLHAKDRMAQASNSSFDAATFEVWGALLQGARLVGVKQDVLLSPRELAATLREHQITTLFITTALFNQVAADAPDAFAPLQQVLFGGEACDPKAVREILEFGAPQRLLHVYGPTETTTFASWFEVKSVPEGATTLPIGKPISNTTFFVLDENLQPVPMGSPGELFIGGDGVARGYRKRADLTAQKFVRNHLSGHGDADKLYRTGDLVRYLSDGNVQFLGRIDNQVKIRGFRIELEEIEAALEQNESVRNAVVLALDQNGGKRLVAYIVPRPERSRSAEKLRQFLKAKLPEFMVPAAFIFLDALPINANGKIDRRALPSPEAAPAATPREILPPRNNLENQLCKIWESILGVKPVGVRDNFFELGGHSLLAIRLFTKIEQKVGVKLPLSTLFQAPTVEQLAQVIGAKSWSAPGASLIEIQPTGTKPPIFWLHTLGGGGGGGLFTYRKLAELLGPDQPSYGLVTPPEPFTRIEDMAAHYINEMRTVQPTGPYHLGGYCFGGIIAFEMARQLADAGLAVGLLALVESVPPHYGEKAFNSETVSYFLRRFPAWVSYLAKQPSEEILSKLQHKASAIQRKIKHRLHHTKDELTSEQIQERLGEVIDFTHYPPDFKRYAECHWRALNQYQPRIFRGRITLFRTARPHLFGLEPEEAWRRLTSETVNVKVVPGTHEKVLEEPYVQTLAQQLAECLAAGQPLASKKKTV